MNNFTQEKVVDQDDNVILCNESNQTIIYDKESKKIIFKNFPYSEIKNIQDFYKGKISEKQPAQPEDLSKYNIFSAHEGVIISVFWYKKWYIIKNKKLNIFTSRWIAKQKTFGEQFFRKIYEIVSEKIDEDRWIAKQKFFRKIYEDFSEKIDEDQDEFQDDELSELSYFDMKNYLDNVFEKNLDKNKKYIFLLEPNSEERNVVKLDKPKLLFLASIENEKLNFQEVITLNNSFIEKPQQFFFKTIENFEKELNNLDYLKNQGFIVIEKGSTLR